MVGTEPVIAQVTIHGTVIIFPYQIFSWEFEDNDHGLECQFSLDATFYNLILVQIFVSKLGDELYNNRYINLWPSNKQEMLMIPARFAPLVFSFLLSILMSCLVSGVAVLNTAGLGDGFSKLWMTAWFKSWIVAFPAISILAPLTRRFVAKITKP